MKIFRRRSAGTPKATALEEARKGAARVRRENQKAERYRARKQPNPAGRMTINQWIGSGD